MTVLDLLSRAYERLARGDLDELVTIELETNLGSYLFQSGQQGRALAIVERAWRRSAQNDVLNKKLTIAATLASLHLSRGDCPAAIRASSDGDNILSSHRRDMPAPLFKAHILNGYIRLLVRQANRLKPLPSRAKPSIWPAAPPKAAISASRYSKAAPPPNPSNRPPPLRNPPLPPSKPFASKSWRANTSPKLAKQTALSPSPIRPSTLADARCTELTQTRWMILIDAAITYLRAGHCEKTPALLREADELTAGKMPPQWKGNRLAVECICHARAGKPAEAKVIAAQSLAAAGATWAPNSRFRKKVESIQMKGRE